MQGATDRPIDRPTESETFLLEEYKHLTESFLRNEELGERRFNFFMALLAAVLVAFGSVYQKDLSLHTLSMLAIPVTVILLLFGIMTLARVVRRDIVTDQYLRGINQIRRYFANKNTDIVTYLYRNPYEAGPFRKREWKDIISLENGGLTKTMEVLNSFTVIIFVWAVFQTYGLPNWLAASVPAGLVIWIAQFRYVKLAYQKEKKHKAGPPMDILTSAEIRWFFEGSLSPEIDKWFTMDHLVSKSETRDDHYLVFPASTSVGVKFRDGKLEIKPLVKELGDRTYPSGVNGHAQIWEKWSYGDKESKPLLMQLQQMLTKDTKVWITVTKERRLRKISMDQDNVIEVNPESRPRNGCNVELTKILVNGLSYWSFSFEAFGDSSQVGDFLDKAARYVFDGGKQSGGLRMSQSPQNYFSMERSFSYPEWLCRPPKNLPHDKYL